MVIQITICDVEDYELLKAIAEDLINNIEDTLAEESY